MCIPYDSIRIESHPCRNLVICIPYIRRIFGCNVSTFRNRACVYPLSMPHTHAAAYLPQAIGRTPILGQYRSFPPVHDIRQQHCCREHNDHKNSVKLPSVSLTLLEVHERALIIAHSLRRDLRNRIPSFLYYNKTLCAASYLLPFILCINEIGGY